MGLLRRWIVGLAIVTLFVGMILVLVTQTSNMIDQPEEEVDSFIAARDGPIVYGANVTGYFKKGDRINAKFYPKTDYVLPPEITVEVGIYRLDESKTILRLDLVVIEVSIPDRYVVIEVANITIIELGEVEIEESVNPTFIGTVTQDGNYTLEIVNTISDFYFGRLVLFRGTTVFEFPYSSLFPFGIGTLIIGVILLVWGLSASTRRVRHLKQKGKTGSQQLLAMLLTG